MSYPSITHAAMYKLMLLLFNCEKNHKFYRKNDKTILFLEHQISIVCSENRLYDISYV